MIVTSLLSSSNFIITNKILIKAVGINAAILIGELCSEYNYWEQKNELKYGEWFYSTRENIEEQTGLSEDQQRRAINKLIKMGLIENKRMDIPCKTYYKLNEANILDCYKNTQQKILEKSKNPVVEKPDIKTSENDTTKDEITQQQDIENLDTNNNKNNNYG